MDTNTKPPAKRAEIEQFLLDVRSHFRASLETSEYENTSNLFHVTAAEQTLELLERCELLLKSYADEQAAADPAPVPAIKLNGFSECVDSSKVGAETGSVGYLEMLSSKNSLSASREYIDLSSNGSLDSDKTFRHSQTVQYDICQNQAEDEEAQQVITHELVIDCPYAELPAGHLALQRSTKYGQLQRIVPKRLFFDQTRKCYCGILNDWMLCYADGPTACRPSSSLYLKSSSIEIEHFGEGKRREICFQIITDDPNKKFVYQANNEVDAKEWIHAIEAAIRGDLNLNQRSLRKLPTPPLTKKINYTLAEATDSIYEEPSPIYTPPKLPDKSHSPISLAQRFEYDVPKCPAQPLEDFQSKVKTVHSELSSQLSPEGPSPERLKKAIKKSYSSCGQNEKAEMLSLTPPVTTPIKEQKKQRKSPNTQNNSQNSSPDCDKLARNWFLSRLNKSAGAKSPTTTTASSTSSPPSPAKFKQSEKENLLNDLDLGEHLPAAGSSNSKVNMIINQFESSGHLSTMFSVETLAANALASLTSFCESDNNCNNYEPIMPHNSSCFLKKV